MKKIVRILFFLLSTYTSGHAAHIVGGEIRLEASNTSNRYTITMVQFWDENTLTNGNRDANAELLFFRKRDNRLMMKAVLPYIGSRKVSYQNKACAAFRSLQTVEGTYSTSVLLSSADFNDPEGYYVIWERCCRNDDINNIIQPGSSGMVFYLEFPPVSIPDSSPIFQFPNGEYICKDQFFTMDMSANDADGDNLVYSLVTPLRGNTSRNNPIGNDFPKSGYPLVEWSPGISLQNSIPGTPSLRINAATGMLSVTANQLGLFVFSVQCEEFRNGQKIGVVRRDFQLLVIECSQNSPPEPVITYNKKRTSEIEFCSERPVVLETEAAANWSYQWQLNGQNIPGAVASTITVQDTGRYSVVKSFTDICSKDTSSQQVKLKAGTPPGVNIEQESDTICEGEIIQLQTEENSGWRYQWQWEKEKLPDTTFYISVKNAGNYQLFIQDLKTGCINSDSSTVWIEKIKVETPLQLSVLRGNSLPLPSLVQSSAYPITYQWSPSESLNSPSDSTPICTPISSTDYIVQVTSPFGCLASDTIQVTVFDRIYIPDAFSPNGDGFNDLLEIQNGSAQIQKIMIYNRWGQVMFHSKGYDAPWDGSFRNERVPSGFYLYVIETPYYTYKGTLSVLY
ncbi:gliding motility-associated C-terminal domain-containing protein [Arundinibacter roseus]|nr:gliding motility-associated C-terminal domain-containing protein [Arundinibacter roseus]